MSLERDVAEHDPALDIIDLEPGAGRTYDCGTMRAVFLADGAETRGAYSISEWTLEPGCTGVGAHSHDHNDDLFYVVAGTVTFIVDGVVRHADPGAFVRVPVGIEHDFRNDGDLPARFLNIYVPGGFEADMPSIVEWFATHPS